MRTGKRAAVGAGLVAIAVLVATGAVLHEPLAWAWQMRGVREVWIEVSTPNETYPTGLIREPKAIREAAAVTRRFLGGLPRAQGEYDALRTERRITVFGVVTFYLAGDSDPAAGKRPDFCLQLNYGTGFVSSELGAFRCTPAQCKRPAPGVLSPA